MLRMEVSVTQVTLSIVGDGAESLHPLLIGIWAVELCRHSPGVAQYFAFFKLSSTSLVHLPLLSQSLGDQGRLRFL